MAHRVGTIEVRRQRGKLVVNGIGRAPRGQKFIAKQVKLSVPDMADKNFKKELESAVKELLGSGPYTARLGLDIDDIGE